MVNTVISYFLYKFAIILQPEFVLSVKMHFYYVDRKKGLDI